MKEFNLIELKKQGYTIIPNVVKIELLNIIEKAIEISFIKHKKIQKENGSEIRTNGVALHALIKNKEFMSLIEFLINKGLIKKLKEEYFEANCILNSMSAFNNIPRDPNFSSNVHRDLRFYSNRIPLMINILIMIDDFTVDNGATYVLPYSHLKKEKPTNEEFYKNAIQTTGAKGSIIVFDSNVWHASGPNKTESQRRAIPMTISRSFMKQLLDYPRAIGYKNMDKFSNDMQQFLGYHSRVPASLEEWYQPEEFRFYKKDQD